MTLTGSKEGRRNWKIFEKVNGKRDVDEKGVFHGGLFSFGEMSLAGMPALYDKKKCSL